MRVVAWLIGAVVLLCGVGVYVKAPTAEMVATKTVLYIGSEKWSEPWVEAYPEDSEALVDKLAGTEYQCVVVQPQNADCCELLNLLQRTQPLARLILVGDEDLRELAGAYRMEYRFYEKDRDVTWKNGF